MKGNDQEDDADEAGDADKDHERQIILQIPLTAPFMELPSGFVHLRRGPQPPPDFAKVPR